MDRTFDQHELKAAFEQMAFERRRESHQAFQVAQYLSDMLGTLVKALPVQAGAQFTPGAAQVSPDPTEYFLSIALHTDQPGHDGSAEILARVPGMTLLVTPDENFFEPQRYSFRFDCSSMPQFQNHQQKIFQGRFELSKWSPPGGWV